MINSLVESLRNQADKWHERGSVLFPVSIFILLGVAFIFGGAMAANRVPYQWIPVTLGSLGGLFLFVAGYVIWYKVLPENRREQLNFRGTVELPKRRIGCLIALLVWFGILIVASKNVPGPILGGLTTAVLLTVWRVGTATPEEWDQINAESEEYEEELELGDEEEEEEEEEVWADNVWDDEEEEEYDSSVLDDSTSIEFPQGNSPERKYPKRPDPL